MAKRSSKKLSETRRRIQSTLQKTGWVGEFGQIPKKKAEYETVLESYARETKPQEAVTVRRREGITVRTDKKTREKIFTGYHASQGRLRKIHPEFHIGTRHAALMRLPHQARTASPRLYKVSVRTRTPLGSSRSPVSDFIANQLSQGRSREKLGNIDAILYRNAAEDPGSLSITSLDPKKVKVKDVTPVANRLRPSPMRPLGMLARAERALKNPVIRRATGVAVQTVMKGKIGKAQRLGKLLTKKLEGVL